MKSDRNESNIRTGIGFDAHRLEPNVALFIGGVEIPYEKGLQGHSDGDVLIHAIIDSLLGAANLGDIGKYFPSHNLAFKGVASTVMLKNSSKNYAGILVISCPQFHYLCSRCFSDDIWIIFQAWSFIQ